MAYRPLDYLFNPYVHYDSTCFSDISSKSKRSLEDTFDVSTHFNCYPDADVLSRRHPYKLSQSSNDSAVLIDSMASSSAREKKVAIPIAADLGQPPMPILPTPHFLSALAQHHLYPDFVLPPNSAKQQPLMGASGSFVTSEALSKRTKTPTGTLAFSIALEFKDNQTIVNDSTWIRETLFPLDSLPTGRDSDGNVVQFSDKRLYDSGPGIWNTATETFASLPTNLTEPRFQDFLNWMVRSLGMTFNVITDGLTNDGLEDRSWDCRSHSTPLTGASASRKPDICLVPRAYRSKLHSDAKIAWPCVHAFAEVTSVSGIAEISHTIAEKAYLLFETQPFRRFVYALAFHGPLEAIHWTLTLVDRSGFIQSGRAPLKGPGAYTLARVVYALAYGPPILIGLDPSMEVNIYSGSVEKIFVNETPPNSSTPIH